MPSNAIDLDYARAVIDAEAAAVASLREHVNAQFGQAAQWIVALQRRGHGRVVGTGMGKAGIVAQKVCATLASTGTPALFLHPVEALHGDLGMVTAHDVLLAFSNSGASEELTRLLPAIKRIGAKIIAITGRPDSMLGRQSDLVLSIGSIQEPCPLRLAPSASTTAMLAFGDALALCVLKASGFSAHDYARLHPGGALGRKLRKCSEIMRTGARCVKAGPATPIAEALELMSGARCGAVLVVDLRSKLLGIFTDGDFRRLMLCDPRLFRGAIGPRMTSPCQYVFDQTMATDAQDMMGRMCINALPVVDKKMKVLGLLDIQDLVQ